MRNKYHFISNQMNGDPNKEFECDKKCASSEQRTKTRENGEMNGKKQQTVFIRKWFVYTFFLMI